MTADQGHRFHPSILREYDIRGLVGRTLSAADATAIGRTFGSILRDRKDAAEAPAGLAKVVIGYDGRLSSPELAEALTAGFVGSGCDVVQIGLGPTPMLYYATRVLEADGGVMVTGSHNPPEYNGFKMVIGKSPFWGKQIAELGLRAEKGDWRSGEGTIAQEALLDRYVERLAQDYTTDRGLRIAWDAGNGATGVVMTRLTQRLPGQHILLNETVDGTFPAHHPDPTVPENLEQLRDAVAEERCDLGIGFDGDGDRIGVVDGQGRILWGDQLLAIMARDLLQRQPGATVIADVKASNVLFDEIARNGGKPVMSPTGHSIIKAKMAELGAPLAGEMSGHIFYGERYYGYDDALYAAVRLIDIVARSDRTLAAMRDSLPQVVNTPEIRFEVPEERKFAIVQEIRDALRHDGAKVSTVDGVRVTTDDGWWLLRASNTQNVLVIRCESSSEAGLGRLKAEVVARLRARGLDTPSL